MKAFVALVLTVFLGAGCSKPQVDVPALQSELQTARTELTALKTDQAKLKSELAAAQARISELQPLATKARTLPVRIGSRWSRGAETNVYQLVNVSEALLPVRIKLHNPQSRLSLTFTPVLPPPAPAKVFEIGPTNGWILSPGDVIELSSEGYDVLTKSF